MLIQARSVQFEALSDSILIHLCSQGGWSAPGALAVTPIYSPLPTSSPANPLGSGATSAPTTLSSNALLPLVYWYGHAETTRNPLLMDRLIRNMGENVNDKYEFDPEGVTIPVLYSLFDDSASKVGHPA